MERTPNTPRGINQPKGLKTVTNSQLTPAVLALLTTTAMACSNLEDVNGIQYVGENGNEADASNNGTNNGSITNNGESNNGTNNMDADAGNNDVDATVDADAMEDTADVNMQDADADVAMEDADVMPDAPEDVVDASEDADVAQMDADVTEEVDVAMPIDSDGDLIADVWDNCPHISNVDQSDLDEDDIGDVCDEDVDGDTVLNENDNCPTVSNADQTDLDEDSIGDACDEEICVTEICNDDRDNDCDGLVDYQDREDCNAGECATDSDCTVGGTYCFNGLEGNYCVYDRDCDGVADETKTKNLVELTPGLWISQAHITVVNNSRYDQTACLRIGPDAFPDRSRTAEDQQTLCNNSGGRLPNDAEAELLCLGSTQVPTDSYFDGTEVQPSSDVCPVNEAEPVPNDPSLFPGCVNEAGVIFPRGNLTYRYEINGLYYTVGNHWQSGSISNCSVRPSEEVSMADDTIGAYCVYTINE